MDAVLGKFGEGVLGRAGEEPAVGDDLARTDARPFELAGGLGSSVFSAGLPGP